MSGLLSLAQFAAKLAEVPLEMQAAETLVLTHAAKHVQQEAKKQIGHYADAAGPFGAWAPLAETTLADKERAGYAPPDNPLLRSGDMRDSIEYTVLPLEAHVGSNDDKAVYQELGTHGPNPGADGYHVPPRSFLGSTAFREKDQIGRMIGFGIVQVLVGSGSGASVEQALLHDAPAKISEGGIFPKP